MPGSPFPVRYIAADPYARSCSVTGLGLWTCDAGQQASFFWVAKDKYGNDVRRGGHPFTVSIYGPEVLCVCVYVCCVCVYVCVVCVCMCV